MSGRGSLTRSKYIVRLLPIAEEDLGEIIGYVAAERPSAAARLADRIDSSLARLSAFPKLGRIPKDSDLAELGYRHLILDDYLVFYKIEARTVLIYRILHGASDYHSLL